MTGPKTPRIGQGLFESEETARGRPGRPVVFVHGLWKSAAIWTRWVERFQAEGFRAVAPLWPGERPTVEDTRAHPEDLEGVLLADAIQHLELQLVGFDELPIIIGHSFGALIAEKLLATGMATAAVAIDPAQSGVALPGSIERLRRMDPDFGSDPLASSVVSLTLDQFHQSFCVDASDEDAKEYYDRYYIPASANPLLEVATEGFRLIPELRVQLAGPLLLIPSVRAPENRFAEEDPSIVAFRDSIFVEQNLDFLDAGHSVVFDHRWERVADVVIDWLEEKGLRS